MSTPTSTDVLDAVRRRLISSAAEPTADHVAAALRADGRLADSATVLDVVDQLRRDGRGLGPLERAAGIAGVTDILVNGTGEVFIDRGGGLEPVDAGLSDSAAVRRLAQRLAAQGGRRLDHASPWVDARLPGGIRLHAVLDPIARPGPVISLRVPTATNSGLDDLQRMNMVAPAGVDLLRRLVSARVAFVVSGGTGAGKSTLLSALLAACPRPERLVLVEDSSELRPQHPHVVALEARPPNVEGIGEVTMRDLVRQALRMRPDRLVVGEVRGAEVVDLLAALNTGHEGGCGTVHANSVEDVPARFEALAVAAGLSRAALHSQLAAGLRVVLHVGRDRQGTRRLLQIGVLQARPDGLVVPTPAAVFDGVDLVPGPASELLTGMLRR
ncbi:MAG: TadA family conjugal transfer-associated ATPase [Aeromicrobium sp.]